MTCFFGTVEAHRNLDRFAGVFSSDLDALVDVSSSDRDAWVGVFSSDRDDHSDDA